MSQITMPRQDILADFKEDIQEIGKVVQETANSIRNTFSQGYHKAKTYVLGGADAIESKQIKKTIQKNCVIIEEATSMQKDINDLQKMLSDFRKNRSDKYGPSRDDKDRTRDSVFEKGMKNFYKKIIKHPLFFDKNLEHITDMLSDNKDTNHDATTIIENIKNIGDIVGGIREKRIGKHDSLLHKEMRETEFIKKVQTFIDIIIPIIQKVNKTLQNDLEYLENQRSNRE